MAIGCVLFWSAALRAEPPAPIKIEGKAGEVVNVSVVVHDATNLGAFEFRLEMDPAVLDVAEVGLADFMGSTGRAVSAMGPTRSEDRKTVTFAAYSLGTQPGPGGDGVLAVVGVKVVKDGGGNVALARHQLTDVRGQLVKATVLLRTDVHIERVVHLEARRFLVTLDPGDNDPARLRRREVAGNTGKLLREMLYKGETKKAQEEGRHLVDGHEPLQKAGADFSEDGTLIVIDVPQSLDKVAEFLSKGEKGKETRPALASLWVPDNTISARLNEVLKAAKISEPDIEKIRKMMSSEGRNALGFRLASVDAGGKAKSSLNPALMDAEIRRIKSELGERVALVVGLPVEGTLLVISDARTLDHLEKNILHTLAAGEPKDWKLLGVFGSSVYIQDGAGYVQCLSAGKADASGVTVASADEKKGEAKIVKDKVETVLAVK